MRRIAELDGLRGLAAIGIVGFHFSYPGPAFARFWYIGGASLELFFVLSGFLISSIILANAGEPGFIRAFYIRRGLRIWPIYYLIILSYAFMIWRRPDLGDLRALPYYLTFTQFTQHYVFRVPIELAYPLGPTWSLAIEEQFYLLWPLLIGVLGRRAMGPLALAFVVVGIVARLIGFNEQILIGRCDGFALGALLAVVLRDADLNISRQRLLSRLFALLGAVGTIYLFVAPELRGARPFEITASRVGAVDRAVIAAVFACAIGLVVQNSGRPALAPLRARWLVYLGTISYGIYLYHLSALLIADALAKRLHFSQSLTSLLVAPMICLAIAAASWTLIEQPFLRLKNRFAYRQRARSTSTQPSVANPPK